MRVQDVMTENVRSCERDANLARVTQIMWENDCGIVPVVDGANRVLGVLTDRDVCIALGTRDQPASTLRAGEVMTDNVRTAKATDEVGAALGRMREGKVRRVPVVDERGALCGLLSLDDVVLAIEARPQDTKMRDAMITTLKAICQKWKEREVGAPA